MRMAASAWWSRPAHRETRDARLKCVVWLLAVVWLSGCTGVIELIPTQTPTPDVLPLAPSPTVDIHPPTPVGQDGFESVGGVDGVNNATAAALPNFADLLPNTPVFDPEKAQVISVPGAEGSALPAEFFAADGTPLGLVLLLGLPADDWAAFPTLLRDVGFSTLSVELRPPALDGDFSAMIDTLRGLALSEAPLIAVGSGTAADLAFTGCAAESRCAAAGLLSPQQALPLLAAAPAYGARPLLLMVSLTDSTAFGAVEALRGAVTGQVLVQPFDDSGSGAEMLIRRPDARDLIVAWLRQVVG